MRHLRTVLLLVMGVVAMTASTCPGLCEDFPNFFGGFFCNGGPF